MVVYLAGVISGVLFILVSSLALRSRHKSSEREESGDGPKEAPCDLLELPVGTVDNIVEDRFRYFSEQLEEHVGKNLGSYQLALSAELEWIKHEKKDSAGAYKAVAVSFSLSKPEKQCR